MNLSEKARKNAAQMAEDLRNDAYSLVGRHNRTRQTELLNIAMIFDSLHRNDDVAVDACLLVLGDTNDHP